MRIQAPAKINLDLRVGQRDASGYHRLSSWFCTVALFDTLIVRASVGTTTMSCDDTNIPCDGRNLMLCAVEAIRPEAPAQAGAHLHIDLQKRIPVGAGLGGGSSDAARILLALDRLWDLRLTPQRLLAIGESLGSDVPFFLEGRGSALCSGRGQIVQPIAAPKPRWALLILPPFALSTSAVYAEFDRRRLREAGFEEQSGMQEWTDLSAGPLLARLQNDLEPAAFALAPQLRELRDALETFLGRVIRMTGSGSALFTLFDEGAEAEYAAAQVLQSQPSLRALAAELAPHIDDDLSDYRAK